MVSRLTIACVSAVALLSAASLARSQQNPYRLKEPDQRKLCITCHTEFEQKLKSRFIHTPIRSGECSGCHDPHVSSHGKLLSGETAEICAGCHERLIPADAKSAHQVVANGECQSCHDPHASDNPANLLARGNDLCFRCHAEIGEAIKRARFKHGPVQQGCLTCHAAHGSEHAVRLLKREVPALCVSCHKAESPGFVARHAKYPVGKASCTACHDPHGSSQPALMLDRVHAPLSRGTCSQCHEGPESSEPFATKRAGYELCKGCHGEMVNATLAKKRLHWPVADQRGCANCHNPHASKHENLLKAGTPQLCGDCHADTLTRVAAVPVKHAPVDGGTCSVCHSAHGSEGVHLIDHPSIIQACTTCHDYERHSAHPIGEKAIDPRNKNLRVDCLSCHKAHGTDHKWMLLATTNLELCTRCHTKYTR